MGHTQAPVTDKPVIWLHAASVGELTSVRPYLSYLAQNHADHQLLVTTNNTTALHLAARWPDLPMILQPAPFDLPWVVNRFISQWQPSAFINVEAEFWPNRFHALANRKIPMIALNARLSKGSARNIGWVGAQAAGLLQFAHIFTQNSETEARLTSLGVPSQVITQTPNLKALVQLPQTPPELLQGFQRQDTLLAASTHPGEDEIILTAFAKHLQSAPDARLILAPRHDHRAGDVLALAQTTAPSKLLSHGAPHATITVADKLGDLPKLYALAATTIVGGSLVPNIGGHTPYEPIRAGSAIISGSHTHNFADEYAKLDAAGGATIVQDAETLAQAIPTSAQAAEIAACAQATFPAPTDPSTLFAEITKHLRLASQ